MPPRRWEFRIRKILYQEPYAGELVHICAIVKGDMLTLVDVEAHRGQETFRLLVPRHALEMVEIVEDPVTGEFKVKES